jgi:hypothetical protein
MRFLQIKEDWRVWRHERTLMLNVRKMTKILDIYSNFSLVVAGFIDNVLPNREIERPGVAGLENLL